MPSYTIMRPSDWESWSKSNGIVNGQISQALEKLYTNTTIYERLDNLIALYEACKEHRPEHPEIQALQESAAKFIEIIGNSANVEETIAKRKEMRETWPSYLPNIGLQHIRPFRAEQTRQQKLIQRLQDHVRALGKGLLLDVNSADKRLDELSKVKMLSPLEKEAYRIMPSAGQLWQLQQPQNDETPLTIAPFDTADLNAHHGAKGRAIFVLNPQGEMFAGSSEMGKFHHSSFQSGGFVAYGGTMAVENGDLCNVDDYSGHYLPGSKQFFNVLQELRVHNLITPKTEIYRKFDERSGIRMGGTKIDTLGFLGFQTLKEEPKSIDHYHVLQDVLYNTHGENMEMWRIFAIVMAEHLSNLLAAGESDELLTSYKDVTSLKKEMGVEDDFATQHPEQFQECVQQLEEIINSTKGLKDALGGTTDWLVLERPEQAQNLGQ